MGLSCFKSWKHDSTGHKGNRDVLASPGSYFFLSNSAGQGDEWLKSLNKGVWIPFTGVFGQSLEETVLYERRYGLRLVPLVVEQCVSFIREHGLYEVGLFRQPGQASLVRELQEAFDAGERPSFDSSTDVHTVASLLKLYLRQLPEPLIPYNRYQDFLLCGQHLKSDRAQGLEELRNLLHELPVANFNLLNFICQFLHEVQSYSGSNKMGDQNLATVFGPNIMRAKAEDPQSIMGGAALVHVLMLEFIRSHESLFAKVAPPVFSHPPAGSRASPTPLRHPHLHLSPCLRQLSMPLIAGPSRELEQSSTDALNHSCAYSSAANSDSSWAQKRLRGHRHTSSHPENCFFPLPPSTQSPHQYHSKRLAEYNQDFAEQGPSSSNVQTSATSLQHQEAPEDSVLPRLVLAGWTKVWPGPEEDHSEFWDSSSVVAGEDAEQVRKEHSEVQEDSTPSAYENVDTVSSEQRMEDAADERFDGDDGAQQCHSGNCVDDAQLEEARQTRESSSSWSSCEFLPLDDSGTVGEPVSPFMLLQKPEGFTSGQTAEEEKNGKPEPTNNTDDEYDDAEKDGDNESVNHPNSPASMVFGSPLSTGSSEVFLPSGPPDLHRPELLTQSRDAQSLLAKLQQEMAQQEAEYQARIQRLERCNDVLERQVAVLRISLEQQKRSQSVAEIKIRNMERAKADADRRNSSLQREMELFFKMYGEIRKKGGDGGRGSL